MRYFIEHSYNGTAYVGWQIQNNGNTIQEELEKKLRILLKAEIKLTGSSRTDTGVHAKQQFAHFDTETPIQNVNDIVFRLNGMLPYDIAVRNIIPVEESAHSRFDATHRRYCYKMARQKDPFQQKQAYYFRRDLDMERMNEAAQRLVGRRDFESFSKIHTGVSNFYCDISSACWIAASDDLWEFHIKSNRFLRGMVRALVGTLIEVGEGKRSIEDFEELILARDRKKAGPQAPPHGLYLMEVGYEPSLYAFAQSYRSE